MTGVPRDPWAFLAAGTAARIALGRAGASLPTREVLAFALAHARARDAVHADVDWAELTAKLAASGLSTVDVASRATDRAVYLRRPDLGRALDEGSRTQLASIKSDPPDDLVLLVGDGLSGRAIDAQAHALVAVLLPHVARLGLRLAPVVLARGARVALGDEVGGLLGARLVAVLIGERPGLSAADSLGVYLTHAPAIGRTDAERNCISNVRMGGLPPVAAAANLAWLIDAALAQRSTGITLKDQSAAPPRLQDTV